MSISELKPNVVWKNFHSLTQIPRPSKHEEKASEFLYNFGKSLGLETIRDEVGNIIIRKPATPGFENRMGVILQGHMDMVPQKNSDVDHDFEKDPIQTWIDGEWVKAKGTTLGADNGIGVALAMAVLESKDIEHGPVELLVTIDEETGMTGADALAAGVLKGDLLINCDSEAEGELCVGCAGGLDTNVSATYTRVEPEDDYLCYSLIIKGLLGGHSGMDIKLYRANSNVLAARILLPLLQKGLVKLLDMEGGTLRNAIPRETECTVYVPAKKLSAAKKMVSKLAEEIMQEFAIADPNIEIIFAPYVPAEGEKCSHADCLYVEDAAAECFMRAILACPNGVERMSDSIEGLTETSNNLAMVKIARGKFMVKTLLRSSLDSAKEALSRRIESAFVLAGCKVTFTGGYSGWAPNNNSIILKVMKKTYEAMYGKPAQIVATHGGLECGILGSKYPNWDMVSFGPTIMYPHSPDEKLFIPSVERSWEYLKTVLLSIPEK
ncbi:MAG: aminoacyl-histidine dipeptidase [Bacteroidales bacterium]|nr:aminoacyl-histidine dipeptidase [Candidatus Cryptobacteroides caccocaballi]